MNTHTITSLKSDIATLENDMYFCGAAGGEQATRY